MGAGDDIIASVSGITKRYAGASADAVHDVSIELRKGEFYSLLGPSGCGKSTLLRIIGGFETQTAGSVIIGNRDVGAVPANKRPTNMVFQHLGLFPHLSVEDNIAFGLKIKRVSEGERVKAVTEALALVDLEGYGARFPAQLSGGQQQRVAIARALVNKPDVLLLDEPLAALDLKLRHQMHDVLKELQRTLGTTFLYVTHDQSEAMILSDRLAVMHGGRLIQEGAPEEVYTRPRTAFVAGFLGNANVIPLPVADGQASLDGGDALVRVAVGGTGVAFTVRPESIQLVPVARGMVAAHVDQTTFLGASIRYDTVLPDGSALRVIVPVESERHSSGDQVGIRWDLDQAVVLSE